MIDFTPFWVSFKLAALTTFILFLVALPLAWYLSQSRSKFKPIVESFAALPIVLPPSVLGFYLLVAFSQDSVFGKFVQETFGINLVFSFSGLVVASVIYSFPFMLQPLQSGFESLQKSMIEASYIAGKSKLQTLVFVALPNIKPALLSAIIITFAHTVGEFGVVLMVGGSIPGETKVASIAVYEMVETMDYNMAHTYAALLLLISFSVLLSVYFFNRRYKQRFGVR